jgi:hypothetical protein
MAYLWLAGWLLVTIQVLIVGVCVIWMSLCTRSALDIKVGPSFRVVCKSSTQT